MAEEPRVAITSPDPPLAQVRILTPIATGAIAVIQLSGPQALRIAQTVFRPRSGRNLGDYPAGRLAYGDFLEADGGILDDGLAVQGGLPEQPWVEFNLHGGVRIVQRLCRRIVTLGARLIDDVLAVDPRENPPGPIDRSFDWLVALDRWLQQCLARATTPQVVEWLIRQSALWRDLLADWRIRLETGDADTVRRHAETILARTDSDTLWQGRTLAIVGLPNAGKSTIANRLAGQTVSLVADAPGTTRDWVGQPIALQGWPVFLVDTAGLRTSEDPVETEGVARALRQAQAADLRLFVLDSSCAPDGSEGLLPGRVGLKSCDVMVYAKCDLPAARHGNERQMPLPGTVREVFVSSLTGVGWSELVRILMEGFGFSALQEPKPLVFCSQLRAAVGNMVSALLARQTAAALAVLDNLAAANTE